MGISVEEKYRKEKNMDSTVLWLVLIQGVGFALIAVAFFVIALFLKGLIDRLITLIDNLNDKVTSIDGEIKPILQDIQKSLSNIEPLTKELGERGEEIGQLLGNVGKVTDDAQATTGAIRKGIVPIANTLTSLFAGVMQGVQVLKESGYSNNDRYEDEFEIDRGEDYDQR